MANASRLASAAPWALALAAAALAAYAVGLLYEGFVRPAYSGAFTGPFIDRPAAERAYDAASRAGDAGRTKSAALRLARADPANPQSWTALAYADASGGRLTPASLAALARSYRVGFFDYRGAVWRVGFAFDHWSELTPALRRAALVEGRVALADPMLAPSMRARLGQARDPEGRFAAALLETMPAPGPKGGA